MGITSQTLRFGDVVIDLEDRVIYRNDGPHPLIDEYWNALVLLIERRPNTVSKAELRKALGGSSEETLAKQIELIRKTLDPADPYRFIRVVRKRGYRFIAVVAAGTRTAAIAAIMPGLVAHYDFDGETNDLSGNGNHGTVLEKAPYIRVGARRAISFDGKSGYVSVEDSPSLRLDYFTLSAWLKLEPIKSRHRIVEKGSSCSYWLYVDSEARLVTGFYDNDHDFDCQVTSEERLSPNETYFVCGTFDGARLKLYINGKLAREKEVTSGAVPWKSRELLYIGWKPGGVLRDRFAGVIGEVRIYNLALDPVEIEKLYSIGRNQFLSE